MEPDDKPCSERRTVDQRWRLSLLGDWMLSDGWGERVPTTPAIQRLTTLLALRGPRSRAHVAGLLWPDASEQKAHGSLRSTLWRVRRSHPGLITATGTTVQLDKHVTIDAHEVSEAAQAILRGAGAPPEALALLSRPELLPGWYDDWILVHREQIRQLQMHALERLAESLFDAQCYAQALHAALTAVELAPLRESTHRRVARIHLAIGDIDSAIRQFTWCRRLMDAEFGLPPTERFVAMMRPVMRTGALNN